MKAKHVLVSAIAVITLTIGGLAAANAGASDDDSPGGDNRLTPEYVEGLSKATFTNTTPEEVVEDLKRDIADLEAEAAAVLAGAGVDQPDSSAQEEAASYLEKAAAFEKLLVLVCEQETAEGC
jgi:hypothetical protein